MNKTFTVLICDKHIINDCHNKYHIYLKPFLDDENFAFCQWNTAGSSPDEAVGDLKNLIKSKKTWRAVVVNDSTTWGFDVVNKRNPFDFVDSTNEKWNFSDFSQIKEYRKKNESMINKALKNPLTGLAIWLCGYPFFTKPELCYKSIEKSIENPSDEQEYFDKLKELGITAENAEKDRIKLIKYNKISEIFNFEGEFFNAPVSFFAIAERAKDTNMDDINSAWKEHTEFDYSRFYIDNLYPQKTRYLIYDNHYINGIKDENKYFEFLTLILLFSLNDCPDGVIRPERVYKFSIEVDSECVKEMCNKYNGKLLATVKEINELSRRLTEETKKTVDSDTAELYFETPITVAVKTDNSVNENELTAKYDNIGLSKDCPNDEDVYWDKQYHRINKIFIKYLREPRKAVKKAVQENFRCVDSIDDEKALRLNEYQREDIEDFLLTEENEMISTVTTHLFNTEKYKKQIEKSDKDVRNGIEQRMTKNQTVKIGLISAIAYFLGFLPLIFGNLNTSGSFLFSLGIAGITTALFLIIGFCFLFVLKMRHIRCIQSFNDTLHKITEEIKGSLEEFSKYLSHACNVMREFSVLNYAKNTLTERHNIFENHKSIINSKIKEVNELFSNHIDLKSNEYDSETPYMFDFSKLTEYEYLMPYSKSGKKIDFLLKGNTVTVPVDYLKSVDIIREELYD